MTDVNLKQRPAATGRRARTYPPSDRILDVPGVALVRQGDMCDEYNGTAEQLAAAGLLPLELFPGRPGQNAVSATYRPEGCRPAKGERLWCFPGTVNVSRRLDGTYRLVRYVEHAERERRRAECDERERQAKAAADAVLAPMVPSLREYCEKALRDCGGPTRVKAFFTDPAWLAKTAVTETARRDVLSAIELFELAAIERELVLDPDAGRPKVAAVLARLKAVQSVAPTGGRDAQ